MRYTDLIIDFNNDQNVLHLREFYATKSFPEILGVCRRELSHSSFLAWLFSSAESHALGIQPVVQLLELYIKNAQEQKKVDSEVMEKLQCSILTRQVELLNTFVATEEQVEAGGKKGRADITILCDIRVEKDSRLSKLRIVIENKVCSIEHDNQTRTYYQHFQNLQKENEHTLYVFLSPSTQVTRPECEQFVSITYQDLLDYVLTPLTKLSNISVRTKFIMEEYMNSLSVTSEETPLALSQEEKELLCLFWESHNKLIMAAITAFAETTDDSSVKEACTIISSINSKRDRDKSRYEYNGKVYSRKTELVRKIVSDYVESQKGSNLSLNQVKDYFKFQSSMDNIFMDYTDYLSQLKERKGKGVGFFGNKEDIFKILLEDGTSFIITNNWPLAVNGKEGEFKRLLARLEELGIFVEQV